MSGRRTIPAHQPPPNRSSASFGWFEESTSSTRYERTAAHSTPRRAQPSRRLRSYFLRVKTARVMTTGKISSPVNFDSAAAAKAVPKRSALDGEGSVQISPSCYKARSVNNITGTLVITSGPKVRKVGVVT